jgi:uncharacterized protein (AIM24 family)
MPAALVSWHGGEMHAMWVSCGTRGGAGRRARRQAAGRSFFLCIFRGGQGARRAAGGRHIIHRERLDGVHVAEDARLGVVAPQSRLQGGVDFDGVPQGGAGAAREARR